MTVTIGVLHVALLLPSETLKEKRAIVKSVVERLRGRFNASVAEADALDDPRRAVLVAACVSNDPRHADQQVQVIARTIEEWRLDAEVETLATERIAL